MLSVHSDRGVHAPGAYGTTELGYAEYHPVTGPVEVGDVLSASAETPGRLQKSNTREDPAVIGIVVETPAVRAGEQFLRAGELFPELKEAYLEAFAAGAREEATALRRRLESAFLENFALVAMGGTAACKVDATLGNIAVGDLLASASAPGRAMRADNPMPGTIIGKAMEPMPAGQGTIKVLVMAR
jgi:hypothetical protein